MTFREQALFMVMIWLCVYPSALVMTYAFDWLGIEVPLPLEILVSTAVSVPLISLIAAPKAERLIARARGQTPAELKLDEARKAEGPSPEDVIARDDRTE